jgi:hypothetical protein
MHLTCAPAGGKSVPRTFSTGWQEISEERAKLGCGAGALDDQGAVIMYFVQRTCKVFAGGRFGKGGVVEADAVHAALESCHPIGRRADDAGTGHVYTRAD